MEGPTVDKLVKMLVSEIDKFLLDDKISVLLDAIEEKGFRCESIIVAIEQLTSSWKAEKEFPLSPRTKNALTPLEFDEEFLSKLKIKGD